MRCAKCKGRHHISICPGTVADSNSETNVVNPDTTGGSTLQLYTSRDPPVCRLDTKTLITPQLQTSRDRSSINTEAPIFFPNRNRSASLWVN